ncbi:unnamed protein product [Eruca vesicaria subsp. sativa]|uniref:Uncharacterized protein n=1 Tax=Eruca vesicaria subsp. sativa TaxID=29727 RepID=A0ABC8KFR7_ERUVS|nr:unnamed protein product [Eruca vesicaria subsp. sativa]
MSFYLSAQFQVRNCDSFCALTTLHLQILHTCIPVSNLSNPEEGQNLTNFVSAKTIYSGINPKIISRMKLCSSKKNKRDKNMEDVNGLLTVYKEVVKNRRKLPKRSNEERKGKMESQNIYPS